MYALEQTVAPTSEPLTVEEVKDYLKIQHGKEDGLIGDLAQESRQRFERITSLQLLPATFRLTLDGFPGVVSESETAGVIEDGYIRPPRWPLRAVSSISYEDTAGATQTLAAAVYVVDTRSRPGRVGLADGQEWPDTLGEEPNEVTVTFTAGHDNAAAVPQEVKGVLRKVTALLYLDRGVGKDTEVLEEAIYRLCRPFYHPHLF